VPLKDPKARAAYNLAYAKKHKLRLRGYHRQYKHKAYHANLEEKRAYQRLWYSKNRKKRIAARTKYVKENVLKVLAQARRYRKLPKPARPTPDNCECCGVHRKLVVRNLALDHDHDTGAFRGWLCGRCNTGIGSLGDNLAGVLKAVAYLRRYHRRFRK